LREKDNALKHDNRPGTDGGLIIDPFLGFGVIILPPIAVEVLAMVPTGILPSGFWLVLGFAAFMAVFVLNDLLGGYRRIRSEREGCGRLSDLEKTGVSPPFS
jgi:hypothetical protein